MSSRTSIWLVVVGNDELEVIVSEIAMLRSFIPAVPFGVLRLWATVGPINTSSFMKQQYPVLV